TDNRMVVNARGVTTPREVAGPYARTMAQGREQPAGYDWEDGSVPAEPEPLVLPDHRHGTRADGTAAEGSVDAGSTASGGGAAPAGPYGAPSFTYAPQAAMREPRPRRR